MLHSKSTSDVCWPEQRLCRLCGLVMCFNTAVNSASFIGSSFYDACAETRLKWNLVINLSESFWRNVHKSVLSDKRPIQLSPYWTNVCIIKSQSICWFSSKQTLLTSSITTITLNTNSIQTVKTGLQNRIYIPLNRQMFSFDGWVFVTRISSWFISLAVVRNSLRLHHWPKDFLNFLYYASLVNMALNFETAHWQVFCTWIVFLFRWWFIIYF